MHIVPSDGNQQAACLIHKTRPMIYLQLCTYTINTDFASIYYIHLYKVSQMIMIHMPLWHAAQMHFCLQHMNRSVWFYTGHKHSTRVIVCAMQRPEWRLSDTYSTQIVVFTIQENENEMYSYVTYAEHKSNERPVTTIRYIQHTQGRRPPLECATAFSMTGKNIFCIFLNILKYLQISLECATALYMTVQNILGYF